MTNKITDLHTEIAPLGNKSTDVKPQSQSWLMGGVLLLIAGLVGLLLIWLLPPSTDPYTQSVLQLKGNPAQGRSIFVMNCVACHGQWANGKVGPSLRGVSERKSPAQIIHQVVSGETPPMPQFQPNSQDMADLLSYLEQL